MEEEPVERRRPVPDGRVGEPVETSLPRLAWPLGLVVGKPVHARARDELDSCACARCEPCALEAGLAASDDEEVFTGEALELGRPDARGDDRFARDRCERRWD